MQLSWPALWVACANAGVSVERLIGAPPVDLDDDEMRHAAIVLGGRELHRTVQGDPDVIEDTTGLLRRFEHPIGGATLDVDGRELTVVADDAGALSWLVRDGDLFTLGSGTHDELSALAAAHLEAITPPTSTGGTLEISIDDLERIADAGWVRARAGTSPSDAIRHVVTIQGSRRVEQNHVVAATVFVVTVDGVYEIPDPSVTNNAGIDQGRIIVEPVGHDTPIDAIGDAIGEAFGVATGELSVEPTG